MTDWTNKQVTILGLGRSGISAATYLTRKGARVCLSEASPGNAESNRKADELRKLGVTVELGGHSDESITSADLVVVSPGIPPQAPVIQKCWRLGKEVICDIELAYRESGGIPMIAITGTNGKSTTCALVSHILTRAGKTAPACGNFGVPILNQLTPRPDFLVVEVSSYQLAYCSTLSPYVAIWLNLTPDHLEWHGGFSGYVAAKQKLFAHQEADQYAILNQDDPLVAHTPTQAQIFPFSVSQSLDFTVQGAMIKDGCLAYRWNGRTTLLCTPEELQIKGQHNLENALSAVAAAAIAGVSPAEIGQYLKEFQPLEHRLEYVATVGGVPFYNDSKATNTDSAIKALEAFGQEKIVLIAGGRDKGTILDNFVDSVKGHASAVLLIGESRERFAVALKDAGFQQVFQLGGLAEAVEMGEKLKLGPVVLSPACASFDMFKDYEDRGRVFKDLVRTRLEKLTPLA